MTGKTAPEIRVEIRIPISATEAYFRMTRYLLESVHQFGGPIARSARYVLCVSGDMPRRDLSQECAWADDYNVRFHWCDPGAFGEMWYHATILERMALETTADIVILADADIFCAGNFDSVIHLAHRQQQILGLIAPWSPFVGNPAYRKESGETWWARIFKEAGLEAPRLDYQHPGWGYGYSDPNHRVCPFYLNGGFIVAPAEDIQKLGGSFRSDLDAVARICDTIHKSQIATAVGIARHGLAPGVLGWQYNCPPGFPDARLVAQNAGPDAVSGAGDIKIFHYLAVAEINKSHFETQAALDKILQKEDLSPTTSVFQHKLRAVNAALCGGLAGARGASG